MGRDRSRAVAAEESSIRRAAREVIKLIGILLVEVEPSGAAGRIDPCPTRGAPRGTSPPPRQTGPGVIPPARRREPQPSSAFPRRARGVFPLPAPAQAGRFPVLRRVPAPRGATM